MFLAPETLERRSRALKIRYCSLLSNKPLSHEIGSWVRPITSSKNTAKSTPITTSHTKKQKAETFFFNLNWKTCRIRRGFKQLSSSTDWRVMLLESSARKRAHAGLTGLSCVFACDIIWAWGVFFQGGNGAFFQAVAKGLFPRGQQW